jgi:hypothetical protein
VPHIFMLSSSLAEASVLPSEDKATERTQFEWPLRVASTRRVLVSQSFTVLSSLAEARILPYRGEGNGP